MGNKIKYFLAIVFFPVVIIFYLAKKLIKKIQLKLLEEYLSKLSIDSIDTLSGEEFEELLFAVFLTKGYTVTKTKKSHDYGADLILTKNDIKIVIQCKLYYNRSVSNSAVQEISTAKAYYQADCAIVITNSTFTKPATILAENTGVKLIGRDKILHLINNHNDNMLLGDYDNNLYINAK